MRRSRFSMAAMSLLASAAIAWIAAVHAENRPDILATDRKPEIPLLPLWQEAKAAVEASIPRAKRIRPARSTTSVRRLSG